MKIGSSRNINKGEFDKSTLFKSPAAQIEPHVAPKIHLKRSLNKSIKNCLVAQHKHTKTI